MDTFSLTPDEQILRSDLVNQWQGVGIGNARVSDMVLTNERILFLKPDVPTWYTVLSWTLRGRNGPIFPAPIARPVAFALGNVKRLWEWQPEFSGAPAFQVGEELHYFALVENKFAWDQPLPVEAVREHFKTIEVTWSAARARTEIT